MSAGRAGHRQKRTAQNSVSVLHGNVMQRRVVVTGIGLCTPLGLGREATWQALIAGQSGIGPITHFDTSQFATRFAGRSRVLTRPRSSTSGKPST